MNRFSVASKPVMFVELGGLRIPVAEGWTAVGMWMRDGAPGVRMFLAAEVELSESGITIETAGPELWLQLMPRRDGETLPQLAERVMKRSVPSGDPDRSTQKVKGREALLFDWTNGINQIRSWFWEPAIAPPGAWALIVDFVLLPDRELPRQAEAEAMVRALLSAD